MKNTGKLYGVGGWLGLLIIILMLIGPVLGVGAIYRSFLEAAQKYPLLEQHALWGIYQKMTWGIFVVLAGLRFSAGYQLWKKHKPKSVKYAILILWVTGPVGVLFYLMPSVILSGMASLTQLKAPFFIDLLGSCIPPTLWTAYLMRSVRVKNTYFSEPEKVVTQETEISMQEREHP